MIVLSLFDGISCGQLALKKANIKIDKYFASEIEKDSIKITQKNFPNTIQLGDVTKIDVSTLPKIDLLIGGSPCQSFSKIGNGLGFDGKSKLFFEYVRILKEAKPTWFLLENVEMKKEWEEIISKELGVVPIRINSKLFSAQNRPRMYWTNIPIHNVPILTFDSQKVISDILESNALFSDKYPNWLDLDFCGKKRKSFLKSIDDKASCLTATMWKGQVSVFCVDKENRVHKFSPIECERLQTIDDDYTLGISNTSRYRAIGNGWTVNVIKHILSHIPNIEYNKEVEAQCDVEGNDGIPSKTKVLGILPNKL